MGLSQSVYSLRTAEKISFKWNENALRTYVRNSRLRCSSSRPYCNANRIGINAGPSTHTVLSESHLDVGRIEVIVALGGRHANHDLLGDKPLAGVLHGELRVRCVVQRQERSPRRHKAEPGATEWPD